MQQLFRLLIFLNQPNMFRGDKFAHPQEHFLIVYTADTNYGGGEPETLHMLLYLPVVSLLGACRRQN